MSEATLTILNLYELRGTAEEFTTAVERLVARVDAEGHPGVLAYRFFVNPAEQSARAVIDYEDPTAWVGHHEIAMGWPEMAALHSLATLVEITFLGLLTPEIERWIATSTLTARLRHGYSFASGFRR